MSVTSVLVVLAGILSAGLVCAVLLRVASVQAASQRARTVNEVVQAVIGVASDKLATQTEAGAAQLALRSQAFEQKVSEIGTAVTGVSEALSELRRERARQHGELARNLELAAQANGALVETTDALRQALASPKARGQWGERMAEDVLGRAGFAEGINYRKQKKLPSGAIPDFTFMLPGGLDLHMDVKFPIDNYLRWLEASETEKPARAKAFLRDVRGRVAELVGRGYIDPETTVDQLLMFIPNESVYEFLHLNDPGIVDAALEQRIVLCSPLTLFSVLAVVRQAVDNFRLERTSDEVLRCLGGFTAEWDKFTEQLDKVGRNLGRLNTSVEELSGPRRRMLERQLDRIDSLGASRQPADEEGLSLPTVRSLTG